MTPDRPAREDEIGRRTEAVGAKLADALAEIDAPYELTEVRAGPVGPEGTPTAANIPDPVTARFRRWGDRPGRPVSVALELPYEYLDRVPVPELGETLDQSVSTAIRAATDPAPGLESVLNQSFADFVFDPDWERGDVPVFAGLVDDRPGDRAPAEHAKGSPSFHHRPGAASLLMNQFLGRVRLSDGPREGV